MTMQATVSDEHADIEMAHAQGTCTLLVAVGALLHAARLLCAVEQHAPLAELSTDFISQHLLTGMGDEQHTQSAACSSSGGGALLTCTPAFSMLRPMPPAAALLCTTVAL